VYRKGKSEENLEEIWIQALFHWLMGKKTHLFDSENKDFDWIMVDLGLLKLSAYNSV
jgi:hypothetical protein